MLKRELLVWLLEACNKYIEGVQESQTLQQNPQLSAMALSTSARFYLIHISTDRLLSPQNYMGRLWLNNFK